ncbi:MAG: hypothetical protein GOMPHAMPRED_001918 [Gomphillus americanus]|uniref:Uncharacterized protein n=1 Tax=Gomphillus americanus TaxID=1940652 RepID=A0A8H3F782_9LECA|nr:MAG: hypothetical protein GOMPHAMPRED_001918 [Gomphillus americanus]
MSALLTTSSQRNAGSYPALVPILAGIFGGVGFLCLCGLIWCLMRRRKHRAPVIPYAMGTLRARPVAQVAEEEAGRPPAEESVVASPRPEKLGTHGRGVGYGFNPVFNEAYGGGGGAESGKGPVVAARAAPLYG